MPERTSLPSVVKFASEEPLRLIEPHPPAHASIRISPVTAYSLSVRVAAYMLVSPSKQCFPLLTRLPI